MTLELKKGSAAPVHTNLFGCIYGEPGVRKTSWAITAEAPLLLDFDQRGHRAYDADRAMRIDVTSFDDIAEAAQKYNKQFKTLIVDTAGRALDTKTQEIIRVSKATPSLKAHNPFGGLSLPGYAILKNAFYGAAGDIKRSGMDCVFVAHGKKIKENDVSSWEPDVVGSSADEIYKFSDLMGLISPINGRIVLRCNPSELWAAKNPLGLATVILDKKDEPGWDVTLADLLDQCRKKISSTNTPIEPPAILKDIEECKSVERANELLAQIQDLPEGVDRDMASSMFRKMRNANGFKYTKDKGVHQ